jgi:Tfp pilus assembly protein FimT
MKCKGVSVVELIIGVVVVAVIAVFTVPGYYTWVRNKAIDTTALEFKDSLALAQNRTLVAGVEFEVCPRSAVGALTCGSSGDWNNGWLIAQVTPFTVLQAHEAPQNTVIFNSNSIDAVIFQPPNGYASPNAVSLTLTAPNCTGNHTQTIAVSSTGNITQTTSQCN